MTEFQPEDTGPTPDEAPRGAMPYQGIPNPQGQPFDPQRSYAQQPPAPHPGYPAPQAPPLTQLYGESAPMAAPAYGQAPTFGQPYGESAPMAAPAYGQAPTFGQPYGQTAPMAAPPQNPAWGAPPPNWISAPAKKRKAWPWVVGGIGALVVLGGISAVVAIGVFGAMNTDQNQNYTGAPIAAGDAPTLGDKVLISDSGAVAFDIGSGWVDANDYVDITSAVGPLPEGGSIVATYFTADPSTSTTKKPSLVMVVESVPPGQVTSINLKTAHQGYISGALKGAEKAGIEVTATDAKAVTTAHGLDGLVTSLSMSRNGVPMKAYEYTFVRSKRVVYVQIVAYDGTFDDATAALVTNSLRINK